jgi:hypothetical protein
MSDRNNSIIGIVLLFFSLFEFYYFGVRIFDFAGFFLLLLSIFFTKKSLVHITTTVKIFAIYLVLLWAFTIINNLGDFLINNSPIDSQVLKSMTGYTLCFLVFFLILFSEFEKKNILKIINYLLIFHGIFLLLQLIYYYFSGNILNFIPDNEARLISSVFRPAGMFLEPAHYSLTMVLLLSIKYLGEKKTNKIFIFSLLTIFLSLSLWGIISALFLLLFIFLTKISFKKVVFFSAGILSIIGIIWFIYNNNDTIKFLIDYSLLDRFDKISENQDNSINGRIGSSLFGVEKFGYSNLFGTGFTSRIKYGGANLLSLIVNNFGLVGALSFYILFLSTAIKKIYFFSFV